MAIAGPTKDHELNGPHEFGDANLQINEGDALAVLRTRTFTANNATSLPVVLRGMSEFLLDGTFLSVSHSGFKRFETVLNDVSVELPAVARSKHLSAMEARFGPGFAGITAAEDEELRVRLRRAFAGPAMDPVTVVPAVKTELMVPYVVGGSAPDAAALKGHELSLPHEFGDKDLFIPKGDALAVERIRYFKDKNSTTVALVHRGLSEFLLEGSFLSPSRSGFKAFVTNLNDLSEEFPELRQYVPLSGWEARFGRSWTGITKAEDARLREEARKSHSEPARGRSIDLRQRRNGVGAVVAAKNGVRR